MYTRFANKLAELSQDSFEDIQKKLGAFLKEPDEEPSILFLGTGQGAHNVACRGRISLKNRFVSGPIIQSSSKTLWIDPGPDSLEVIERVKLDPRDVDAVFVSHAHPDHYGNLACTIEAICGGTEIKKEKSLIANKTVLRGGDDSPPLLGRYHRELILGSVDCIEPLQSVRIGDMTCTGFRSHHRETVSCNNSLNLRVEYTTNGKQVALCFVDGNIFQVGDDGQISDRVYEDVVQACQGANILIVNVANHVRVRTSRQNYPSSSGTIELLKLVKPSVAFLTHFGIEMLNPNENAKKMLSELGCSDFVHFQNRYVQEQVGTDTAVYSPNDFDKFRISDIL